MFCVEAVGARWFPVVASVIVGLLSMKGILDAYGSWIIYTTSNIVSFRR
jgi:hypothetical protein